MNIRTFAAIELPQPIRDRVRQHIAKLKAQVPECNASWGRVENVHLTINFFGDVDEANIPRITEAAFRTVKDLSPFEILVSGTGAFPKPSQPRVIWIGINDPTEQLLRLKSNFENECARMGFPKEGRTFRPHLTIARIRKPEGSRRLAEANNELGFEPMKLVVDELIVFRSELSSKGSKYTALSRNSFA